MSNHLKAAAASRDGQPAFIKKGKERLQAVTALFIVVVLVALPLFFHDYYYDILRVKYWLYCGSVLAYLAVTLILAGLMVLTDRSKYEGRYTREFLQRFLPGNLRKTLTWPDAFMLLFLVTVILSTLFSDYRAEAFWGNEGRYTGLFLLLLYGTSFFLISRLLDFKAWFLDAFLGVGLLVCLFGITDYLNLNLLHFKDQMLPDQYPIFTSTIGNVNIYTSYVSLMLGVAGILFSTEKRPWKAGVYYLCLFVSLLAMITGQSDNAYLALGAFFVLLPFYLFGSWQGIRRYVLTLAGFFTSLQIVSYVSSHYADQVLEINGLFDVLSDFKGLPYIVAGLWTLAVVFYICKYLHKKPEPKIGRWLRILWGVLLGLILLAVIYVLYDANIAGNTERYGAYANYLIFNDDWGTHRGMIWRLAMENYREYSWIHKLFGYGPDTFGIINVRNHYQEMASTYGEVFDSAHNEYLQYFVTIGPIGLFAYLGLLISSGVRMVRRAGENPWAMAILCALFCYGAQAFVNINLPIVAPIMWTLLMMGLAICRKSR